MAWLAIVVIVPVEFVWCGCEIWLDINWSVVAVGFVVEQRQELVDVSVLCAVTKRRPTCGCDEVVGSVKTFDDRIDDGADVTVYGVACTRCIWPIVGFGIFGDQTVTLAHGKSPTKRSPTDGLASGCDCEVIFT